MKIVDAQVHTWLPQDDPKYPWAHGHKPHGWFENEKTPDSIEQVIADMDEAGVGHAIAAALTLYGADNSYLIDSARKYPDRVAAVARVDWKSPRQKQRLETLMSEPAVIGIRLAKRDDPDAWEADGEFGPMLAAAEELGVPVCGIPGKNTLFAWGRVAKRHPALRLIVDHLGLEAPPHTVPEPGPEPFKELPNLLALAEYPNLYVKMTASAALSNEPYPFRDIWPYVGKVVSEFGAERVMWGSDYNRVSPLHTYKQAIDWVQEADVFDDKTREQVYSGTVRAVYGWPN
jgi:L-fuconolactonase